jgi:hypothetical protein
MRRLQMRDAGRAGAFSTLRVTATQWGSLPAAAVALAPKR